MNTFPKIRPGDTFTDWLNDYKAHLESIGICTGTTGDCPCHHCRPRHPADANPSEQQEQLW